MLLTLLLLLLLMYGSVGSCSKKLTHSHTVTICSFCFFPPYILLYVFWFWNAFVYVLIWENRIARADRSSVLGNRTFTRFLKQTFLSLCSIESGRFEVIRTRSVLQCFDDDDRRRRRWSEEWHFWRVVAVGSEMIPGVRGQGDTRTLQSGGDKGFR